MQVVQFSPGPACLSSREVLPSIMMRLHGTHQGVMAATTPMGSYTTSVWPRSFTHSNSSTTLSAVSTCSGNLWCPTHPLERRACVGGWVGTKVGGYVVVQATGGGVWVLLNSAVDLPLALFLFGEDLRRPKLLLQDVGDLLPPRAEPACDIGRSCVRNCVRGGAAHCRQAAQFLPSPRPERRTALTL